MSNSPKRTSNQQQGQIGETFFQFFVTKTLQWVYRPVPQEADFGIDGYIDILDNSGGVTGRTLAIQIKCGESYFNKTTDGGIRYDGKAKHLNYYLNSPVPTILIVLNDDCSQGKWVEFDTDTISKTTNGWWIEIPKKNDLLTLNKSIWEIIAGPVKDYSEQIAEKWLLDEYLEKRNIVLVVWISKDEIEKCDFSRLQSILKQLTKNRKSLLRNRGKLDILVDGYNNDSRELPEIPEVRKWYVESAKIGIPWFYFAHVMSEDLFDRGVLATNLLCSCDISTVIKGDQANFEFTNRKQMVDWYEVNRKNLNDLSTTYEIPLEINKERFFLVHNWFMSFFTPQKENTTKSPTK